MKRSTPVSIVSASLLIVILLTLFFPELMVSPGKTINAHSGISTDCFACHSVFIGTPPEKCIACHKIAEIGLKTTIGLTIEKENKNVAFHQRLIDQDCISCHSDHYGVKAFRPVDQFTHDSLEPALQEKCASCHQNPDDDMHQKLTDPCKQCHSQDSWTPATFEHDEYFLFDKHHDTECATCHLRKNYSEYTCYGCHEHTRSNIRSEHYDEGIREYENCTECHPNADEDEAIRIWRSKQSGDSSSNSVGSKYFLISHQTQPYLEHFTVSVL